MPLRAIDEQPDWHARYQNILRQLSDMPASKFTAGEICWLSNELHGPIRATTADEGAQLVEQLEFFLKKKLDVGPEGV